MPRRKTATIKPIGSDASGRFFKNLGYIKSATGKYSQKKFYLGYDEDFARLAAARLNSLWKCVCDRHEAQKAQIESCVIGGDLDGQQHLNYDTTSSLDADGQLSIKSSIGKPIWTELTLCLAETIRQGKPIAKIPLTTIAALPEFLDRKIDSHNILAPWIDRVRLQYPVIHIEIDDEMLQHSAQVLLDQKAEKLLSEGERLSAEPPVNQRLYHAIETYTVFVKQNTIDSDGETSEWGKTKTRQIDFVKSHAVDVDLSQLGGPTIDAILNVLSRRPITKRNNHCSKGFVKSCNKEFKVFLKWLDDAKQYHWKWPAMYEYKPPKTVDVPEELKIVNKSRRRKIKTYTPQELVTIYEFATPIQRAYLLLSLNCGFANAELVTLLCDDIFLRQQHPDQGILNIDTSDEHSWIARQRTKTDVLGTWKLWPETIMAIEWWQSQRDAIEIGYHNDANRDSFPFEESTKGMFFITTAGKPIAEKNRRTGRIPNAWNSLLDRIQEQRKEFKRLSFKYLRKTGSSFVRELSTRELAKAYLSQGQPAGENDDVEAYANLPYKQLFDVLDDVHILLKPVWDSVDDPFPEGRKLGGKVNIAPEQIKRIKRLRNNGVSVAKIAEEMGLNQSTVYRWSKIANESQTH